ncbi:MAG: hypothetical protein ACKVZ0_24145 [Gemmatimonadales bacterium]
MEWTRQQAASIGDDLLLAPLYETLAYFGQPIEWPQLPRHSAAHWARFVEALVRGDEAGKAAAIRGLVNTEVGFDRLEGYLERFASAALCRRPYESVAADIAEARGVLQGIGSVG